MTALESQTNYFLDCPTHPHLHTIDVLFYSHFKVRSKIDGIGIIDYMKILLYKLPHWSLSMWNESQKIHKLTSEDYITFMEWLVVRSLLYICFVFVFCYCCCCCLPLWPEAASSFFSALLAVQNSSCYVVYGLINRGHGSIKNRDLSFLEI